MRIKSSEKAGIAFGFASSIITTLGLMVGIYSGTNSQLAVLGAVITIAVADAFSDSLAMHISKEAGKGTSRQIWEITIGTFLSKFFFAIIFVIPILLFDLKSAVYASIILGLVLLGIFSYGIAVQRKDSPKAVVGEHLLIASAVIVITYYLGRWISIAFV